MNQKSSKAKQYAKALYEEALLLDKVHDFKEILTAVLSFPWELKIEDNKIFKILKTATDHLSEDYFIWRNFLTTINTHKRINLLPEIAKIFAKIVQEADKVKLAIVKSPNNLNNEQLNLLKAKLTHIFKMDISIKEELDKNILAGVEVTVDDMIIRNSLPSRISEFAKIF